MREIYHRNRSHKGTLLFARFCREVVFPKCIGNGAFTSFAVVVMHFCSVRRITAMWERGGKIVYRTIKRAGKRVSLLPPSRPRTRNEAETRKFVVHSRVPSRPKLLRRGDDVKGQQNRSAIFRPVSKPKSGIITYIFVLLSRPFVRRNIRSFLLCCHQRSCQEKKRT